MLYIFSWVTRLICRLLCPACYVMLDTADDLVTLVSYWERRKRLITLKAPRVCFRNNLRADWQLRHPQCASHSFWRTVNGYQMAIPVFQSRMRCRSISSNFAVWQFPTLVLSPVDMLFYLQRFYLWVYCSTSPGVSTACRRAVLHRYASRWHNSRQYTRPEWSRHRLARSFWALYVGHLWPGNTDSNRRFVIRFFVNCSSAYDNSLTSSVCTTRVNNLMLFR